MNVFASRPMAGGADVITGAWWQPFRVPFRSSFQTANASLNVREGVVLGIETGSGAVGLGEASPLAHYTGGNVREAVAAVEQLVRHLVGRSLAEAWAGRIALANVSPGGAAAARCGVEGALADLLAQAAGLPLHAWFGMQLGLRTAGRVPVNGTIDATDTATALPHARSLASEGFGTLKLKVGVDAEDDLARVRAVRGAVGPAIELRIDANGSWTADEAKRLLPRFADLGVTLCEQPVSAASPAILATLAALRPLSPIAIAADESCRTLADVEAIVVAAAADVLVLKPMASGLTESLAMIRRAREADLPVIVTTMLDAGPGATLAMHLAAVAGDPPPACGLATLALLEDDLLVSPPAMHHGWLDLPTSPGLGVRLDDCALERYSTAPRRRG